LDHRSALIPNHACWHAYGRRSIWNIVDHYSIRSNPRMVAYRDRAQNLGARTNVDMTTDFRRAVLTNTERYLLEQQAVRTDFSVRMDDDAVRMRQQQAASQLAIERNIGAGHDTPISVPQYRADPRQ
jgi:hypothetical protein